MKNVWIKITLSLVLLAVAGVGTWAVIEKLDAGTFKVLTGVLLTLLIVVVVGALFIGYGLVQAYVMRRTIQQDDMNDLRQMAMLSSIMKGGGSKVSLNMPEQYPMLGQGQGHQMFDGAYRDTTARREIEVE